jgi:hypothetical protein
MDFLGGSSMELEQVLPIIKQMLME